MRDTIMLFGLMAALLWQQALAQTTATTNDGREVILSEDFTWRYAETESTAEATEGEQKAPEEVLFLAVEKRIDGGRSCTLGLRLTNRSAHRVDSMVPQLSAMTADDVLFDTVFVSFHSIKPTLSQYAEASIRGLSCTDIARIRVHGADRCDFAELDKYNATNGECLARVQVQESELIVIAKD